MPRKLSQYCRKDENAMDRIKEKPSASYSLPAGTVLHDRYRIADSIGEGGFGITYHGTDLLLECEVAIKEFFPAGLAGRDAKDGQSIHILELQAMRAPQAPQAAADPESSAQRSSPAAAAFARGKERFLQEARALAGMEKDPVVVGVRDYFEENNTVYIVMEYVSGRTLAEVVEEDGAIPPEDLFRLFAPLFPALRAFHKKGMIHRDISPENLLLEIPANIPGSGHALEKPDSMGLNAAGKEARLRLLDFGSAREAFDGAKTLTVTLKQGYAPVEQYQQKGQGPWTDIYALCATICFCLTGVRPVPAVDRIVRDTLRLPREYGVSITKEQERALKKGLRLQPRRRFRDMMDLCHALYGENVISGAAEAYGGAEKKEEGEYTILHHACHAIKHFPARGAALVSALAIIVLVCTLPAGEGSGGNADLTERTEAGSRGDRQAGASSESAAVFPEAEKSPELPETVSLEMPEPEEGPELPEMVSLEMPEPEMPVFPEISEEGKALTSWPEKGLAILLPVPEGGRIRILTDDEEAFSAYVDFRENAVGTEGGAIEERGGENAASAQAQEVHDRGEPFYREYVEECKKAGFTVDPASERDIYSNGVTGKYDAYNREGARLTVELEGDACLIGLKAPMRMSRLRWTDKDLRKLLPKPVSEVGYIRENTQDFLELYVGDTTKDQFEDYIDRCMEAGFSLSYDRGDKVFTAENGQRVQLQLTYEGFSIMYVELNAVFAE